MLQNNARWGAFFQYTISYVEKEKAWFAWYYIEPNLQDMLDEPSE